MPFDRFMIAPLNAGFQTNVRPWLIPDDAFEQLNNAYVFRGRVRKRFGSLLMNNGVDPSVAQQYSRLRINIGNTPGPLNLPNGIAQLQIGQMFSVGDDMFTVWQLGAGVTTLSTNPGIVATIDNTVAPNTVTFVGAPPATAVYYYPANPVMGLITYETQPINDEPVYAFDTQFAYQFTGGGWERLGLAIWTGTNAQFFWGDTWRGTAANTNLLFVSNFNTADQIKYWDGVVWTNFNPLYNAAETIETARIIVPFKDRLVLLNTIETVGGVPTQFRNRCRFSQNGSPIAADAFREDIPGKGGFLDCSTQEAIISAQFIKDRLIVFFERSTWELVYTGNEILPFRWFQINTELGVESTFSVVPFDKVVLGIGNTGIHACNGSNVERIDQKIPDTVFEIHNENDGVVRVNGIRDYFVEMVYWTFPDPDSHPTADPVFPTRVLVYNYVTGSWALNNDSITVFGYYQNVNDIRWNTSNQTWQQAVETWDSGSLQGKFRQVIGGNQEGFVFIVDADASRNAPALQITNIGVAANIITLTVINHNLDIGEYIVLENIQGMTGINDEIVPVNTVVDLNTIQVLIAGVAGVYTGGGTLARVSNIDILTKQYNFYQQQGKNAYIAKVEFMVDKTSVGQVTVDYFPSSSPLSMITEGQATGSILGASVLETSPFALQPLEAVQTRLWHPVYLQTDGEVIQLRIYMSQEQIETPVVAWSDFQLHAMLFYAEPVSRLQ